MSCSSATGQELRWTLSGAAGGGRRRGRAGRRPVHRAHQVLVQLLGDERRERREQLGHRDERLVERVVGGQLVGVALALPEATPAAAHVPVAEVVDELLDRAAGAGGVVGLEAGGGVLDERVQLADQPAVEQRPLLHRHVLRRRVEAVDVGVHGEEAVRVPQGEQELAHHLVDHVGAEAAGAPGLLAREHEPAEGVGALVVEDVVGLHDVALALAHLLAVGVEDVAEADDALEGAAALDERGDGEQAVEPAARLVDGLADVVGGEALAEELLVLERVVPLAERHGAGVEPGVDDLRDAAHLAGAVGAGEDDVVDVGPVEFQILWNGTGRHLLELRDGADAVRVPLLAAPDGQGRAPVAVAAERPVDVAGEPLAEAPGLDVLRVPDHVVVGLDELVLDRRGADVPGRLGVVEQRRVAAPAEGIAVRVGLDAEQQASGLEVGGDGRVGVLDVDAGPRRDLGDELALGVDGVDHRQVVLHADAHVGLAEGRRDVHDAGAVRGRDVVVADDEVGALVRGHEAERRLVVQAQQLGARRTRAGPRPSCRGPSPRGRARARSARRGSRRARR